MKPALQCRTNQIPFLLLTVGTHKKPASSREFEPGMFRKSWCCVPNSTDSTSRFLYVSKQTFFHKQPIFEDNHDSYCYYQLLKMFLQDAENRVQMKKCEICILFLQ